MSDQYHAVARLLDGLSADKSGLYSIPRALRNQIITLLERASKLSRATISLQKPRKQRESA